jgi:hypothetical protein
MSVGTIITLGIIVAIWGWIFYEMRIAPEVDDEGNIIDKDNEKREDKSL